jgi:hypothetical protein
MFSAITVHQGIRTDLFLQGAGTCRSWIHFCQQHPSGVIVYRHTSRIFHHKFSVCLLLPLWLVLLFCSLHFPLISKKQKIHNALITRYSNEHHDSNHENRNQIIASQFSIFNFYSVLSIFLISTLSIFKLNELASSLHLFLIFSQWITVSTDSQLIRLKKTSWET